MGVVPENGIVEAKDLLPTFSDGVQCNCDARVCTNIFSLHRPSTRQVDLRVGSWSSNQTTEGSNPK